MIKGAAWAAFGLIVGFDDDIGIGWAAAKTAEEAVKGALELGGLAVHGWWNRGALNHSKLTGGVPATAPGAGEFNRSPRGPNTSHERPILLVSNSSRFGEILSEALVREVLAEAGDAAVLEPDSSREAVLAAAERLRAPARG